MSGRASLPAVLFVAATCALTLGEPQDPRAQGPRPKEQRPAATDVGTIDPTTAGKLFKKPGFSPYAGRNFPTRVYWGDTHLHTGWSMDAGAFGATLGPEEAVRFARGEEVVSSTGQAVKLSRP